MQTIPREQVVKRIRTENIWWQPPFAVSATIRSYRRRAYFRLFWPLLTDRSIRRAILLMGPRRVGKTVLLHHAIQALFDDGVKPSNVCYVSVDHPLYNGLGLQDFLDAFAEAANINLREDALYVFFDEIQYLRNWEIHLKVLVDEFPNIKFVASGSAAAALKFKSAESGAGRFTDFPLPPLTFHEYLDLLGKDTPSPEEIGKDFPARIESFNADFLDYVNFGGYPEVAFSPTIQADPGRFVKSDIIDKVLLRDLPGLYGIQDIQELNYLFTTLAYNTAQEVSLEQLSKGSGVAKNTIKRYIEYLQAAFLVKTVYRIDRSAKRFQRANYFKVYLTNPSMRSALFSPLTQDDPAMGSMAETAIFSQWFHADIPLHYARWSDGEVDIVRLGERQKAAWAVEVKWSDRYVKYPNELTSLLAFCKENNLEAVSVTTRSAFGHAYVDGISIDFVPTSIYCYTVGFNLVKERDLLNGSPGTVVRPAISRV